MKVYEILIDTLRSIVVVSIYILYIYIIVVVSFFCQNSAYFFGFGRMNNLHFFYRDKTMADMFMYIPNDDTQNYHFC